jgi:hypothetical protein
LKKVLVVVIALGGGLWLAAYVIFFCLYALGAVFLWASGLFS